MNNAGHHIVEMLSKPENTWDESDVQQAARVVRLADRNNQYHKLITELLDLHLDSVNAQDVPAQRIHAAISIFHCLIFFFRSITLSGMKLKSLIGPQVTAKILEYA
jgi:hypothetical protein